MKKEKTISVLTRIADSPRPPQKPSVFSDRLLCAALFRRTGLLFQCEGYVCGSRRRFFLDFPPGRRGFASYLSLLGFFFCTKRKGWLCFLAEGCSAVFFSFRERLCWHREALFGLSPRPAGTVLRYFPIFGFFRLCCG